MKNNITKISELLKDKPIVGEDELMPILEVGEATLRKYRRAADNPLYASKIGRARFYFRDNIIDFLVGRIGALSKREKQDLKEKLKNNYAS